MKKPKEINFFIFLSFLSMGLMIGIIFPDFDQSYKNLLGHRSIVTHSILLPWLIYFYIIFNKNKFSSTIVYICIGIFLGIAIHLSADLFPKGWRGYALIKFIGNISIGKIGSILWIIANIFLSTYLAAKLFKNLKSNKLYRFIYFIILLCICLTYSVIDNGNSLAKFFTFIFFLTLTFYLIKEPEIKNKQLQKINTIK